MAKRKQKTFIVSLRVVAIVSHEIVADSLEDAVEVGRGIGPGMAIDDRDSVLDWSVKLVGVDSGDWDTDQP
jgi:hypothetical protein